MLDIHAAREGYENWEIPNIGFVRQSTNLGDRFTKKEAERLVPFAEKRKTCRAMRRMDLEVNS